MTWTKTQTQLCLIVIWLVRDFLIWVFGGICWPSSGYCVAEKLVLCAYQPSGLWLLNPPGWIVHACKRDWGILAKLLFTGKWIFGIVGNLISNRVSKLNEMRIFKWEDGIALMVMMRVMIVHLTFWTDWMGELDRFESNLVLPLLLTCSQDLQNFKMLWWRLMPGGVVCPRSLVLQNIYPLSKIYLSSLEQKPFFSETPHVLLYICIIGKCLAIPLHPLTASRNRFPDKIIYDVAETDAG